MFFTRRELLKGAAFSAVAEAMSRITPAAFAEQLPPAETETAHCDSGWDVPWGIPWVVSPDPYKVYFPIVAKDGE